MYVFEIWLILLIPLLVHYDERDLYQIDILYIYIIVPFYLIEKIIKTET